MLTFAPTLSSFVHCSASSALMKNAVFNPVKQYSSLASPWQSTDTLPSHNGIEKKFIEPLDLFTQAVPSLAATLDNFLKENSGPQQKHSASWLHRSACDKISHAFLLGTPKTFRARTSSFTELWTVTARCLGTVTLKSSKCSRWSGVQRKFYWIMKKEKDAKTGEIQKKKHDGKLRDGRK